MEYYDFEYDGQNLSNMGYIICKFNQNGMQTVSNGSQITFQTVATRNGAKHELISTEYSECLEATFQICKNPCLHSDIEISLGELRYIMKWLNRRGYHKFKLISVDYTDLYFESSFNVNRIEIDGKIYGLELSMQTNRPYALLEPKTITLSSTASNWNGSITDVSDEEGYIYPHMEITIAKNGNLNIYNAFEDRYTFIANCSAGEIITFDYPIIHSSLNSHHIQDDFNWNFFRIANTFKTGKNDLTISIPCTIKITYSPIVKLGI